MSENTTPDGVLVQPGQVWQDLDPRAGSRTVTVDRVEDGKAYVVSSCGQRSRISVKRMRNRKGGYTLVRTAAGGR